MSIIGFHRFLISAAILFCALFAVWEFFAYADSGSVGAIILGVIFSGLTLGLAYYLANLDRFLNRREADRF